MRLKMALVLVLAAVPISSIALTAGGGGQPTVRASAAWIEAPAAGSAEARAFAVVDNGTMYDVYVVGAESDAAASIEIQDVPKGAATAGAVQAEAVKEVPVPAYGRLEMSPHAVHMRLKGLKRQLAAGDAVTLVIYVDGGERLAVQATVK